MRAAVLRAEAMAARAGSLVAVGAALVEEMVEEMEVEMVKTVVGT